MHHLRQRRIRAVLFLPLLLSLAALNPAGASPVPTRAPAAAPSPGHAGGRICGTRYCIYAYVDGQVHADALTASGTVKVVDAGVPIARLQVDRVTVATPFATIVNAGPKNLGSAAPLTQSVTATINGHYCQPLLTTIFASGRLSDGTLIKGSVTGTTYYSDYGLCPGPVLAISTTRLAPNDSVTVVTRILNSNDGNRGFATVLVSVRGIAGTPRALRASINELGLQTRDASMHVIKQYTGQSATDAAVGTTVVTDNVTHSAAWPVGCTDFLATGLISVRLSDGQLVHATLPDTTSYRHCR